MVSIDSSPSCLSPLLTNGDIIDVVEVNHTSLLIILTLEEVIIVNKFTFLPVAHHKRSPTSIDQHGNNTSIQLKEISVNTAQMQKLNIVNLFVQTEHDFLIIYQVNVDDTKSLYEVYNENSNDVLQKGLPMTSPVGGFSLLNLIKNAAKLLTKKQLNLENVEHFNNTSIEDELNNFPIEYVKLSIFKIIKVGVGINKYWLKQNSHNLLINNNNCFQVINIKSFNNELFDLSDFDWYSGGDIKYIEFSSFNYFLFTNDKDEIWYLNFENFEDNQINPIGYNLGKHKLKNIIFNPIFHLLLIQDDSQLKLYKFDNLELVELKTIKYKLGNNNEMNDISVTWSSDGEFFTILNKDSGYWLISTKFGNITTNTFNIHNELYNPIDFLTASFIIINANSLSLTLISKNQSQIYLVDLIKLTNPQDLIFINKSYISLLEANKIISFPLVPQFRSILNNLDCFNGNSINSIKNLSSKFKVSKNPYNQFAISYGSNLSISTPYKTGNNTNDSNHILWYNFKNYYMDTLNIVNHVFYEGYLIVINRILKEIQNKDVLIDELIILNVNDSKYATSGHQFPFDSDLIIWRQTFNSQILSFELIPQKNSSKLVILESNKKIVIFDLIQNYQNYRLFIKTVKTIHLSSIQNKILINDIVKINMIDENHFLFLLHNGGFYLLKNLSVINHPNPINFMKPTNNYYQLIKVADSVEFFKIDTIKLDQNINYLYLFQGDFILIYNLNNLIELSHDTPNQIGDEIEDEIDEIDEFTKLILPIKVEIENFQPLKITKNNESIKLVGVEDSMNFYSSGRNHGINNENHNESNNSSTTINSDNNLIVKKRINHKLVLNYLIEFDLINKVESNTILHRFKKFKDFHYCLELLLFRYLTNDDDLIIKLIELIKLLDDFEVIYVNCLRKIEFKYWQKFFDIINTTPIDLMNKLLKDNNVDLCYSFLIIYLNLKKEDDDSVELDTNDQKIIMSIIHLLDENSKWDWCFELCRFIKLLDPNGNLLKKIYQEINH